MTDLEAKYAKTRQTSIQEGLASSVMSGVGDAYITPFAIELSATNFQIGLLSGLASLIGPIAQVIGSRLIERFSRRKIVFVAVLAHASAWLIFATIGVLFWSNHSNSGWLVPFFIFVYVAYALAGSLGGPAWFSLLGEAVPEKMRGSYFAKRNGLTGLVSTIATILASLWLFYAKAGAWLIPAFIAMFILAAFARFVSASLVRKHHNEPITLSDDYYFSLWQFLRKAPFNNFGRFAFYIAATNLAVNVAGPFIAIYMWRDLALNPLWYMAVSVSAGIFSLLAMPIWGAFADRYGNRELLRIGSLIIIPAPLLWLASPNPLYLIFIPQFLLGIGWAAFALAASNFIYDSVTPARQPICVAYQNILNGVGVFIGATSGGLIAKYVHFSTWNVLLFIFVISSILRLIFSLTLLPLVKEVRSDKHPVKNNPLLYFREISSLSDILSGHLYPLGQLFKRFQKSEGKNDLA